MCDWSSSNAKGEGRSTSQFGQPGGKRQNSSFPSVCSARALDRLDEATAHGGRQSSSPTPLIQTRISSGNSLTDTPRKNKVSSNIWASRDPVKLIQMINHRGIPRARGRTSGQIWALAAAVGAARRRVKEGQAPPSNSESVHKVSRCHKHHAHALIVRWPTQRPPWRSPAVPESNCFYHCCNNIMIAFITSVIEAILVDLNGC